MANTGKAPNVATFISKNFNVVKDSVLALILLGLEGLMDQEFICPANQILAIIYSLVIFIVPTVIVAIVAFHLSVKEVFKERQLCSGETSSSTGAGQGGRKKPACLWKFLNCIYRTLMTSRFRFSFAWVLIMITDGRYLGCLAESAYKMWKINQSNGSYPELELESDFWIQISQMTGLVLIMVTAACSLKCGKSEDEELQKKPGEVMVETTYTGEMSVTWPGHRDAQNELDAVRVETTYRGEMGVTWPGHRDAQKEQDEVMVETTDSSSL